MRLTNLPNEFKRARPVMQRIERAGYQAYFVGGSVRDTIIGVPINDVDITSSAYPQEIERLFRDPPRFHTANNNGIKHGTVMVIYHGTPYEITTFRTESGYQDYRRPRHVKFVRSLPEDLKRRDFTINALAMREDGEVTDLFDGLGDIKRRLIRAVGDPDVRFHEDALRMMRAVRFASKLNFRIEPRTLAAIRKYSFLLTKIAVERVHAEFVKMMMGLTPGVGLSDMLKTDLYRYVPDFAEHRSALRRISQIPHLRLFDETQVWSLVSFAFGLTRQQINRTLRRWKSADHVIQSTQATCQVISEMQDHQPLNAVEIYRAGPRILRDADHLANLLGFGVKWQTLRGQYDRLPIKHHDQLAINGGDLIKRGILVPGPELGRVLNRIKNAVITGRLSNQKVDLLRAAGQMAKETKA